MKNRTTVAASSRTLRQAPRLLYKPVRANTNTKMNYHVRISLKSQKSSDETKNDFSEEQLLVRVIEPYEQGEPIIMNGKTIQPNDIDRIQISKSSESSEQIIEKIKIENRNSNVISIGGPSYAWRAASRANDVTDELISGPVGYKKGKTPKKTITSNKKSNNKVFVVHGHDTGLKNDIDIFLRDIGLEPVILHRQADEGLTIIEKFEKHSDVSYAFILLTPDDVGMTVFEYEKHDKDKDKEFELRARQNVIFEFGYFAAKLGRRNVCCIYKDGVTLPNDIAGLLYKKVTESVDSIGYEIIKELRAIGFKIEV
ncbi:TIR domain-containing protein [Ulvibacter antarcticus]|uniref:Putative nucleotide-binding protein with TIR-like domain n=1 Tax=Ulvibacter antarcticus TaxID=442714 RepID=A0A3L9Z5B5_9FLAO|nr:nucleotide-binding protein [Ulvibacter antarcticus]RMA67714.1 putative nucleotide-binding protein with TIR-like domain [Ulvibacter antarcticus]